jgi:xylan 1,4-beta-xylosidase
MDGTEFTLVEGAHPTVDAWTIRDAETATVLPTNYALPRHPIATESIHMTLIDAQSPTHVTIRRIDADHANAKRRWHEMGSPKYLNAADRNVSTTLRQPAFEFKLGFLAFGLAG